MKRTSDMPPEECFTRILFGVIMSLLIRQLGKMGDVCIGYSFSHIGLSRFLCHMCSVQKIQNKLIS